MVRAWQFWKWVQLAAALILTCLVVNFGCVLFQQPLAAIAIKIKYTAGVYNNMLWHCFPQHPGLAAWLIFGIPFTCLATFVGYLLYRLFFYLKQRPVIQGKLTAFRGSFKKIFISNSYSRGFIKQIALLFFYTALFTIGYYLLQKKYAPQAYFFNALQIAYTHIYLGVLATHLCCLLTINRHLLPSFFSSFFTESGSPYNLAIFRIVVFNTLIGWYQYQLQSNSFWAAMPHQYRVSLPYMGWLIQHIPISTSLYTLACYAGIFSAAMAMVGLGSRFFMLLNIPIGFYIMGVPLFFGKMFHLQIWFWFPTILALSNCADVLSIDWALKKYVFKKDVLVNEHPKYAIPLKFVWLHLGIIYFFAGWMKLQNSGFSWALSDSMINQMQVEWVQHYNKIPPLRIDNYPLLVQLMGITVILFELLYIFMVFTPVGRLLNVLGGVVMHYFINFFMYIEFKDLQQTYVSLIDWAGLWRRIKGENIPLTHSTPTTGFTIAGLMGNKGFKYVFIAGTGMFIINTLCGALQIHSWPFSSYPTYSMLVPPTHHYVYFNAFDAEKKPVDVYAEGNKAHFRMESYTPIEDRVYENAVQKDSISAKTNTLKLWNIWTSNVPALQRVDSVAFYVRTAPVKPESVQITLEQTYLFSLSPAIIK